MVGSHLIPRRLTAVRTLFPRMSSSSFTPAIFRVLVIDDAVGIHEDIRRVLAGPKQFEKLDALEATLMAMHEEKPQPAVGFEIDSAFQGEDGVAMVRQANAAGRPYALAFIDMRMPPGIDGRETIRQLWEIDSDLQVVVCTAFSDYTWDQIAATTGPTTRVVILRKPFETIEVQQLAHTLTEKWRQDRQARHQLQALEREVSERREELIENRAVAHLMVEQALREKNASVPPPQP
jgi:CheY-like chemotaxis protein